MSNEYQPVPETMQQNPDGTWQQAIPLPFYGLRNKCECGKKFWKEENYRSHYVDAHTDGLLYKRTKDGVHAIDRIKL